jgi:hypothetical protein
MRAKREHYAARDHQKSERLTFIDEELFWTGEITRRCIEETFGVSEETAKTDLRDYRRDHARVHLNSRIEPIEPLHLALGA